MGTQSDLLSATSGALGADSAPVICPFATINIKLHVPMTLELKPSNFTKWSTAFQATCGKFGLLHHLATASTSRPTDEAWKQADFCVRGWMYSTVSDAVLNLAITDDTQTASVLWTTIGRVFQANKAPRAIFLNHEFHSMTQGDLSIDAYCVRMKEKADELRDVGQPVSEPNLVLNLLRGLNEVYSGVADNIAGQQPLTLATARHQLLLKELRLQNDEKTRAAAALLAAASSNGGFQQPQQQGGRRPNTKKGAQQPFPNSSGGFSNNSGSPGTNKRIPWGFNPWTGERVAPGERVTPPGQRRKGGSGAPGGPGAPAGRNQGILGPSPQAHTAFAPLQASSSGSNTSTSTWDAAGLIAALQNMQLHGNSPWVVDSGASTHMTSSDGMLTQRLPPSISSITVGNGTSIPVTSRGHSILPTPTTNFALNNILVAPSIVRNLLSVRQFTCDNSCSFEFDAHGFSVKDLRTGRVILRCNCDGDLYTMPPSTPGAPPHALLAASSTLWHQRLGHPAPAALERLNKLHAVSCHKVDHSLCHSCQIGKHTRLPFSSSHSITHAPFELVHCDVWTSPINSLSGFSYYLVCLDDFTHYCWVFPLRKKSDAHQHLVEFAAFAKTQFSLPVKSFQADNGTEFVNTATIKFLAAQGTHLRLSCPYTSPQNGKAERIIRTLNNSIRTMLLHASLPPTYWAEGLMTACYLHNRRPSSSVQHEIPYTRLHNQPPTYSHLRVFGCLCYLNMQATSKHKLAPRSTACVFLGYPPSHKGYRCLDLSTRRIIISRHVTFDETTFPFSATLAASPSSASLDFLLDDDMVSVPCPTVVAGGLPSSTPVVAPSHSDVEQPPSDAAASHGSPSSTPGGRGPVPPPGPSVVPFPRVYVRRSRTASTSEPATAPAAPVAPDAPAPPTAPTPTPAAFPVPAPPPPPPPRATRTMTGVIPRVSYKGLAATTSSSPSPVPTNYRSALADANWRAAMMDEYQALVDNNTWQLVPRPPGANVVTGKWIFRHKFHADGSLARHKARWVVRGFSQREGVDYDETFSPVVKPATIRSVLTIAASRAWPIHQLDVKNAFLHGHLEETVYCQQPPGFIDPGTPEHVCRLQKSLYGLKQAPRAWYQRFATFVRKLGFVASTFDTSLFILREGMSLAYLLLYVDDIVLTASSSALL